MDLAAIYLDCQIGSRRAATSHRGPCPALCADKALRYNAVVRASAFSNPVPGTILGMKIVHYPHPALRHATRPLTSIDNEVRRQAAQMLDLMYEARGLGLAAPQIFLPYQMFVMNETADAEQREHERVMINPVVIERKGSVEGEEGCLSFPKLYQKVRRAKTVRVQAFNLQGQAIDEVFEEMPARVCQHEIDHLHGILFIDKMGTIAKLASRGMLREFEREFRKAQERGEIPPTAELEKVLQSWSEPSGAPAM
jgi:peptide deformylase